MGKNLTETEMKYVSLLIKPASGRCNLRCRYCFYEDVSSRRAGGDMGLMTYGTLEKLVKQSMALAEREVSFAFQGGEPMLRGVDFYRHFAACVERCKRPGLNVSCAIQTNGTLIDDEWAEFFREKRFLVGVSMDGTRELHDANRTDVRGRGSWSAAARGLSVLQRHGADVNILCVVTGAAARRGVAIYQNMKKLGVRFLQFIPCLDPLGEERGQRAFSLTPGRYETFLKAVFDQWYRDWESGHYVSVRLFDDYVHILAGQSPGTCATNGMCGQYFTVEADGGVYPCDFYVLDELRMGNIHENTLAELAASPVSRAFCERGAGSPDECRGCKWLPLCRGGCQRDWVGTERNYLCPALKGFFEYAYPRLEHIARAERRASMR